MGRKKKLPHWRDAARAALEAKAREGDPKAIKLLESSFGEAQPAGRPSQSYQELMAITAMHLPGLARVEGYPDDAGELKALCDLLVNRVRHLEQEAERLGNRADLEAIIVFQYRQLRRHVCPHCYREIDPRPWKPEIEHDNRRARVLAGILRACGEADDDGPDAPAPTNSAYRCPKCGQEHVRPTGGPAGWTCPCGTHVALPFRTF